MIDIDDLLDRLEAAEKERDQLAAESEALLAEVERLSRYYKNVIDFFANPCERHSGEGTPPIAEFFEKYGGQCLICVVDNNKALQAENERLAEALDSLLIRCDDSDSAMYGTLSTSFVRDTVRIARGEQE